MKNWVFEITICLAIVVFCLFIIPNSQASSNLAMVQIFAPDEAAPFPYLIDMISPTGSLKETIHQFIFYKYYYYGFPHFALSAGLLLPLKLIGQLSSIPIVMLVLRQGTSVLFMLLSILLLVYMHDGFKSYKSIVLFILLILIPAVVQNNLWWHPDGLVTFLSVLTIYLLLLDDMRLGKYFIFAAVICGISAATKMTGIFFFLTIGVVLLISYVTKKNSLKRTLIMAFMFVLIMGSSFVISNPFLLSSWGRIEYSNILKLEVSLISEGYGLIYEKGLAASLPTILDNYGSIIFLLVIIICAIWGCFKSKNKNLALIIVTWAIPLSVYILTFSHFKFQYWLPAGIPLISCCYFLLPTNNLWNKRNIKELLLKIAPLVILFIQACIFLIGDVKLLIQRTNRENQNESIQFFEVISDTLAPFDGMPILIYQDPNIYLPASQDWKPVIYYDLLDYPYVEVNDFDVLILSQQRINDYKNTEARGIDPERFAGNQKFYNDANNESIAGYLLVQRTSFGLIYINDSLKQFYQDKESHTN